MTLSKRCENLWHAWGIFVVFLAVYAVTAQRGVSWQDSGYFQQRILAGDYTGDYGLALSHPLYIGLARMFTAVFSDAYQVYAINLFSGVGMAVALSLLAAILGRLMVSRGGVVVAVLTLGLAHMVWWMSTIAEVYTWSLAALMAELYCLIRYAEKNRIGWLATLLFLNGAHTAIHSFALLNLPVYGILLLRHGYYVCGASIDRPSINICWRLLIVCGIAILIWLTGAALLVWQSIIDLNVNGDVAGTVKSLLFGNDFQKSVLGLTVPPWRQVVANMMLVGVSFLNPCWFFVLRGLRIQTEHRFFRQCLLWLTGIQMLFWARYFVIDQATFILPTLGLLAVWVGLGYGRREDGAKKADVRIFALVTVGMACAVAGPWLLNESVKRMGVEITRSRLLPFRDEARYWLMPWKHDEHSAAQFVTAVGQQLRAGDILFADSTVAGPLIVARKTKLINDKWEMRAQWSADSNRDAGAVMQGGAMRVFVVSPVAGYAPQALLESAQGFKREGVVFRMVGK